MKKEMIKRIGIFDSGAGGLTVLKELRKSLNGVSFYYLGDTARLPYGSKSSETIIQYTKQNIKFLMQKKVDLIIIACNTASAYSMPFLKEFSDIPIIDVIQPGSERAAATTKNNKIGIIGTRATISSNAYQNAISQLTHGACSTFANPAPLLVPLVEEGFVSGEITKSLIRLYTDPLLKQGIDTLILGCTHYPVLKETISSLTHGITLVDSAIPIRDRLMSSYSFDEERKGRTEIYVTDYPENFAIQSEAFLEGNFDKIEHIDLSKLWRKKR